MNFDVDDSSMMMTKYKLNEATWILTKCSKCFSKAVMKIFMPQLLFRLKMLQTSNIFFKDFNFFC